MIRWRTNVCCEFFNRHFIGTYFYKATLPNGKSYLYFFQNVLPGLMENIYYEKKKGNDLAKKDGAWAHNAQVVSNF